ncbi:MAG: ricin-type beta-trefoil lectin domain protein [Nannocystaceae bacterium]
MYQNIPRVLTLAALLTGLAIAPEAIAGTPPALQAIGTIRSGLNHDKCVDAQWANNNDNVHLWNCHGGENQTWYMTMSGEIRSAKNTGRCLETWNNNVRVRNCNGESWQRWRLESDGSLVNLWDENYCLDLANAGTANGTNINRQWCDGAPSQKFILSRIPWAPIRTESAYDRCLDVYGGGTSNGTNIILWPCHQNDDNQAWYLTPGGELRSAVAADRCLDVTGANFTSGTNIQLYTCNGTAAQKWRLDEDGALHSADHEEYCAHVTPGQSAGANIELRACNGTSAQKWKSDSFMTFEVRQVEGEAVLIWALGNEGYALTDPMAMVQMLGHFGYDASDAEGLRSRMSLDQQAFLDSMIWEYGGLDNLIALPPEPLLHTATKEFGEWLFDDVEQALDLQRWGLGAGANIEDNMGVLYLQGGGATISGRAGIVDVSGIHDAVALGGSINLLGGNTGFTLKLGVFQIDLYIGGIDLSGPINEVEDFTLDAIDWTEQATIDVGDWFDGAANDAGSWVTGAVGSANNAVNDVIKWIGDLF